MSKQFYQALGFTMVGEGEVAIFAHRGNSFILQNYYHQGWADNFMMQLLVDDLDGWWQRLEALDLPGRFATPPLKAPAMQPWGLRVGYLVDPSGVLWHIAERRATDPAG